MADIDYTYSAAHHPFNPNAFYFTNHNALKLAACSNLAYELDREVIQQTVAHWGYNHCEFIDDGITTQLFIAANKHNIIVAFRGTDTFDITGDWFKTILRTDLVDDPFLPESQVHQGLRYAVNNVWEQLLESIDKLRIHQQPIWVTGHSLGGGLALLAGTWLQHQLPSQVAGIYTFGQPRVGNEVFRRYSHKLVPQVFRFVNNNDLIPRLPHAKTYTHLGALVYFTQKGKMTNQLGIKDRIVDRIKGAMNDLSDLYMLGFNDHSMNSYMGLVRRNLHIELNFLHRSYDPNLDDL